jgi:hypothetical protein
MPVWDYTVIAGTHYFQAIHFLYRVTKKFEKFPRLQLHFPKEFVIRITTYQILNGSNDGS